MGYDMQEGTVVRWLKPEGSEVEVGEAIAEIETDKAVVEFESPNAGVLSKILVVEGATVPVGQPIALVAAADEEIAEAPEPEAAIVTPPPKPAEALPAPSQEVRASPVARKLAGEKGIDLSQVKGAGPGGRITKDDVLGFEPPQPAAEPEVAPAAEPPVAPPVEVVAPAPEPAGVTPIPLPEADAGEKASLSKMRQQIGRVTVRSKREAPHYYLTAEIDITEAVKLRSQINSRLKSDGIHVSVNDMIIKACVGALKKHPRFNASYAGDSLRMSQSINVGVAIGQEDGMIMPAILDCGGKTLAQISVASKDLIQRSKSGTLHPQEYTGGTFSVSNMGMFDVSSSTAIIQPPQSAVLAVGTVSKMPVVRDDQVTVAEMMTATLSGDHRVTDGAQGAAFLMEVKRLLEDPLALLV